MEIDFTDINRPSLLLAYSQPNAKLSTHNTVQFLWLVRLHEYIQTHKQKDN